MPWTSSPGAGPTTPSAFPQRRRGHRKQPVSRTACGGPGPDISVTLNAPFYARLFSQILFAHDGNPMGFGKQAEWWGGFVQAEAKPMDALVTYARYDWIDRAYRSAGLPPRRVLMGHQDEKSLRKKPFVLRDPTRHQLSPYHPGRSFGLHNVFAGLGSHVAFSFFGRQESMQRAVHFAIATNRSSKRRATASHEYSAFCVVAKAA